MTFVQSTTGGGGWPLNVFLTPDLKPFFGGTYFPPDARHGRPSFLQLLQQIASSGRNAKMEIAASADEIHARLESATANASGIRCIADGGCLEKRGGMFSRSSYDPVHGGFGGAPKFPQPSIPSLVLRGGETIRR